MTTRIAAISVAVGICATFIFAQDDAPTGGGRRGPAQYWWVNKTAGGVYNPPMRPLWKLSDLKAMHAGQNNWREQIILDPEQDATYNSAAPGAKFDARMHPDTPTAFVVVAGEVRFSAEGQPPASARRGSIVNIMKSTIFSYAVAGDQNVLWVEVNPTNYKTVYPADGPPPAPSKDGRVVKVSFNHTPAAYTKPNQLEWNTFDDGIAKCAPRGAVVIDDHLFADRYWAMSILPTTNAARASSISGAASPSRCPRLQPALHFRTCASRSGGMVDRAGWRH